MELLTLEDSITPYNEDGSLNGLGKELFEKGAKILKSGIKLGVVILSGGAGSRLKVNYPKGLFLIENKTLFDWHILRIQELYDKYNTEIYLYVMTSTKTHEDIVKFFNGKKYECLKDIILFKQDELETLDITTRAPLKLEGKILRSGSGNGDVYKAIKNARHVDKIDAFNVISVDNVLAKVIDEVFIGAFYEYNLDILSKAVISNENEKVGAFFSRGDHIIIKEYSEPFSGHSNSKSLGNICNHLFSSDFFKKMSSIQLPLHEAKKNVSYTDDNNNLITPNFENAIRRERFIFDAFEYTKKNKVMSVFRAHEFSPLKNSISSKTDNPNTCAEALRRTRIKF